MMANRSPKLLWEILILYWLSSAGPAAAGAIVLPYTLDLSHAFHTRSDWRLAITQGPTTVIKEESGDEFPEVGAIHLCFQRSSGSSCPSMGEVNSSGMVQNDIDRVTVEHSGAAPLLLVDTMECVGAMAFSCFATTWIWAYKAAADTFELVYSDQTGVFNNQETRFMDRGPLAGDIILALNPPPGNPPPYSYTITVFHRGHAGVYKPILHYTARSHEGDMNDLPVIDAEMPVIEKRLGVWRRGQAIPVPERLPIEGCKVALRHGIEWCQRPSP